MKAVILGTGRIARDFGEYLLKRGHDVTWLSASARRLEKLRDQITRALRRLAAEGSAPAASFLEYAAASGPPADLLIEATSEDLVVKQMAVAAAQPLCSPSTLRWTASSSIPGSDIAPGIVNVHPFYPLELTRTAEVIAPTSGGRTAGLLDGLGVSVIRQTPSTAFAVNRLLLPCQNEALRLLRAGCSAAGIDKASTAGIFPRGVISMMDAVGLDVIAAGARNYCARMPSEDQAAYAPLHDGLAALTAAGKRGAKNRDGLLCGAPLPWSSAPPFVDAGALRTRFAALFLNTCLRFIEEGQILGPDCDRALDSVFGIESTLIDTVRGLGRETIASCLTDGLRETGCRYFRSSVLIEPFFERPATVIAAVLQSIAFASQLPHEDALRHETHLFRDLVRSTDAD